MKFWKTFWACLLAIVTGSIVSFIFSIIIFSSIIAAIVGVDESAEYSLEGNSVLTIDLKDPLVEHVSSNMMEYFSFSDFSISAPSSIYDITKMVKQAAIDPDIKGIYIKVPMVVSSSTTVLYELRTALEIFRDIAPDKFIVTYGDAYSRTALYLSSVATRVCVSPMGVVEWLGMAVMPTFYKGTLDKLGIEPQIIRNGKFKGAVEPFMLTSLSKENRLQYQSLIDSQWEYIVGAIAKSRGVKSADLLKAADELSIQSASDALDAGLVDEVIYADEVEDWIKEELDIEKVKYTSIKEYRRSSAVNLALNTVSKNRVEVIYAIGEISDMGSESDGIIGEKLAARIAKARENDRVKAIVIRVNSPGGSAIASEVINREVVLATKEKPVVISMGEYAASGGYWFAAQATSIVSSPMTLTGSIGAFGLMFNVQKGAEEILGITTDPVVTSKSADFYYMMRPLTALERRYMQNQVDRVYKDFIALVADGRDMSVAQVDSIGQGRVWSGLQGLENGLVDKIGTLSDAIEIAAEEAGIEDDYSVLVSKKSDNIFLSTLMGSSASVLSRVMPSFVGLQTLDYIGKLKRDHKTIQARLPFNLEIAN